jgi:predicted O-methyltransferase YrrM
MTRRTISLTEQLYDYILSISLREPELLQRLRYETTQYEMAESQISPEQGQFMALLVKLIGAKRTLEVGVFTGYSSLWVALALPEDGQVIACDISEEWAAVARRFWREAGVAHKIDLHLAPAVETLRNLVERGESGSFDFAFIDADKTSYDDYYEFCLRLVRPNGLIAVDNVLIDGLVVDEQCHNDEIVEAIRALNRKLHTDARVDISLVPIGDGLTLVRKR